MSCFWKRTPQRSSRRFLSPVSITFQFFSMCNVALSKIATQPLSHKWPIDNNDSFWSCGYINEFGNKDGCNGRMPCAIALILVVFDNVVSGLFCNFDKLYKYFACSLFQIFLWSFSIGFIISDVDVSFLSFLQYPYNFELYYIYYVSHALYPVPIHITRTFHYFNSFYFWMWRHLCDLSFSKDSFFHGGCSNRKTSNRVPW